VIPLSEKQREQIAKLLARAIQRASEKRSKTNGQAEQTQSSNAEMTNQS
jgi:hypothetical protein